jgi:hypothetical protein
MKAKRILNFTLLALLTASALVSCNDSEEKLEVLTDVYAVNKKFGTEVKSATAYFAYANQNILSAEVTLPNNGGKVELESFPGSIYTLAKEPKDTDFKTTAPDEGSYAFTIKGGNGEILQIPDILSYDGLSIPQFTKVKFSGSPTVLEIEWINITDADGYVIKIFDLSGNLVFNGYTIKSGVNKYNITETSVSGYWSKTPTTGESYLLQLNAFSNEPDASDSNYIYNISEISIGETQIKWGVN